MTKVGLVQFNVDFDSEYLPYSVGLLQAHAHKFPELKSAFQFLRPLYKREKDVTQVARKLAESDIAAFSIYVWNTRYSLEVARRLKELNPKCLVLFGGPNVPDNSEQFLRQNGQVDFTIHAEGEVAFTEFLRAYLAGSFATAPSLRFFDPSTGKFVKNPKAGRIPDLSQVPSPYLTGVFDELMAENPYQTWNVLWETNRGCPFSCTYCDWGSATNAKVNRFEMPRLMLELEWFSKNRIEYLMCADANFGIHPRDIEISQKLADLKKSAGYPSVFAGTFTKNATERSYQIAQILMDAKLIRGYTVSTQSVNETTLEYIKRDNISQETFTTLQARFNKDKLPTYTDLIIGLPGETYESFKGGVSAVVERGQYNKCYFLILSILPNAQMADPAYRAEHGFETVWGPQKNLHEVVREDDKDITEYQELVIGTKTMPKDQWRKTVAYGYMASFVYFNKLLHIPLTTLFKVSGLKFEKFIDLFVFDRDRPEFPLFSKINRFFEEHAASIQTGGVEYCKSDKWLNVWWQPDKMAFMDVCKELGQFYKEAQALLSEFLKKENLENFNEMLSDSIKLNKELVRMPFAPRAKSVQLRSNIYDYYRSILEQSDIQLLAGKYVYMIDQSDEKWDNFDDWCKKVVWYGNKTSAYLSKAIPEGESRSNDSDDGFDKRLVKPYLYG
jgi:radical SAM superfamily enzyme YgiQ (UPF0313 family)